MDLERFYSYLPVPLQNIAVTLEGWRLNRTRYSRSFRKSLHDYQARTLLSSEAMTEFRNQRIRGFLIHAQRNVPYYRRLFKEYGIEPETIDSLEKLSQLPVLTKQQVQSCPQDFISEEIPRSSCIAAHTSGTTGGGLRFLVTRAALQEQFAVCWRYRQWHGIERTTPCLTFAGRSMVPIKQKSPPFWRYNYAGRAVLFSAYHLNPATAGAYLSEMARLAVPWIHGYPSVLSALASFSLQLGIKVPGIRWVTIASENLLPFQARLIEEAFGPEPIQHYAMTEGVANISQCPQGRLHVDEDFAAVEFLPRESGGYRVIGTNFTNLAMPFIRYEVGDIAELAPPTNHCRCGRPGRLVLRIDGRKEDYVLTKQGTRFGRLDHIFKDQIHIREAQIRQERIGHMILLVVRGDAYGQEDEQSLRREIVKRVGDEIDFEIQYVNHLNRTANGKLRFVVSSLREGALADLAR